MDTCRREVKWCCNNRWLDLVQILHSLVLKARLVDWFYKCTHPLILFSDIFWTWLEYSITWFEHLISRNSYHSFVILHAWSLVIKFLSFVHYILFCMPDSLLFRWGQYSVSSIVITIVLLTWFTSPYWALQSSLVSFPSAGYQI